MKRKRSRGMITTTRLTALVISTIMAAAAIALTILRHRRTTTGSPLPATTKVLVFDHAGIYGQLIRSRMKDTELELDG